MGKMACVMLMTPVTFVAHTSSMTCRGISGGRSTPDMKPLSNISSMHSTTHSSYSRVIHQYVNISELLWQRLNQIHYFIGFANVKLLDAYFYAVADFSPDGLC